jgi:TROVE domain
MKLNTAVETAPIYTHQGARATPTDAFHQLKRSVLTCLLWEDIFYEKGSEVSKRIAELIPKVKPEQVAALACEARDRMQLRHVPLYIVSELSKVKDSGAIVAETLAHIVQRADELTEFLAIYWKDKKHPLSAGVKRGLAQAFGKFDAYRLAKYDRESKIKLRDVLFLTHAKPRNEEQASLWKKLIAGELESPDTWEVALSGGKNKKETFERLISEGKLGGLALLRNLRNMIQAGVDTKLIEDRLAEGAARALPFRFIAAAKHAPKLEDAINGAMLKSAESLDHLPGKTLLVIDISGSMGGQLSGKSEMNRLDAACGLAILVREVCERPTIYATAGDDYRQKHATAEAPARRGFALSDAIKGLNSKLGGGGIFLAQCMDFIADKEREAFDRVIVITDEQDCDQKLKPSAAKKLGRFNYMLNVAPHKNGIVYNSGWHQIDGWSEHVVSYILENELLEAEVQQ